MAARLALAHDAEPVHESDMKGLPGGGNDKSTWARGMHFELEFAARARESAARARLIAAKV